MSDAVSAPDLAAAAAALDVADRVVASGAIQLKAVGGPDQAQTLAYDLAHAAAGAATARAHARLRRRRRHRGRPDLRVRSRRRSTTSPVGSPGARSCGASSHACSIPPVRSSPSTARRRSSRRWPTDPGPATSTARWSWCKTRSARSPKRRRAPRRARAPHERRRARGRHRGAGRDRCVRPVGAGRVRRLQRGRRRRIPGDGHRHGGAEPGQPRYRRLADHPARDPHPGPGQGRHGGAEAGVAAQARHRRGDGSGRGDRTRLRQRRRRAQGHGHPGRWRRRHARVRDQRCQDVVHVRGPGRRPDAVGPHRRRPLAGHRGLSLFIVPKPRGEGHGFQFTQDAEEGAAGTTGKMEGRPIDTIGYRGHAQLRAGARGLVGSRGQPDRPRGRARAWLLPADGGLRERSAADRSASHRCDAGGLRGGPRLRPGSQGLRFRDRRLRADPGEARPDGGADPGRPPVRLSRGAADGPAAKGRSRPAWSRRTCARQPSG